LTQEAFVKLISPMLLTYVMFVELVSLMPLTHEPTLSAWWWPKWRHISRYSTQRAHRIL